MAMAGLKPLLLLQIFWLFATWIFVIIATAVIDWSKSVTLAYGIWRICNIDNDKNCASVKLSGQPAVKDCEGAWMATQAFSVISIIWTFFCLVIVIAMLIKPTLIKKSIVLLNICMIGINVLWTFLGWIMWLGVESRGHCIGDYTSRLGSSWFLQLFAMIFSMFAWFLAVLMFLKWKKSPKYYGSPAAAAAAPNKAGSGSGYKDPYYPYGPAPYSPYAGSPSYPAYGYPTPYTSPYIPTPYY